MNPMYMSSALAIVATLLVLFVTLYPPFAEKRRARLRMRHLRNLQEASRQSGKTPSGRVYLV